jgi:deoxyribodipyrimidine photo-lyase
VRRVSELRVQNVNRAGIRAERDYVLYWMIANRRTRSNFALQRAVEQARDLGKPLVVLEALRCDYRWASDRLHAFVIDGMRDNRDAFARRNVAYYPYVEPAPGAGRGLLAALAAHAALVVTDEFPCFFLPRMVVAAGRALDVRLEQVDACGLLPMRAADRAFQTAFSLRRFLQKELPPFLDDVPRRDPLARAGLPALPALPATVSQRWPPALLPEPNELPRFLARLGVDHSVGVAPIRGGPTAAHARLREFIPRLGRYDEDRNHPDRAATSGLSPYLHFGHIGSHEILDAIAAHESWRPELLGARAAGTRSGWWRMSASAEAFLDQLVTWRELGFHFCLRTPGYDRFDTLPAWAQRTLQKHARDRRESVYALDELASARTHDPLWNAAQNELVHSGQMHNAMRMLWGKKVLEWTRTPEEAIDVLIELNNRYGLDGRNPNSYSGIFWCLGRFDRAWGPERPIFGTVRYMSSASAARKWRLREYVARWTAPLTERAAD